MRSVCGTGWSSVVMVCSRCLSSSPSAKILQGTIISIRENPFPHRRANLEKLKLIRSNFANVFRQLSKASSIKPRSELFAVQIRATDEPASNGESRVTEDESPSLLLYYLFDDWRMSYGLIARDDEQFGRQLDRLVGPLPSRLNRLTDGAI